MLIFQPNKDCNFCFKMKDLLIHKTPEVFNKFVILSFFKYKNYIFNKLFISYLQLRKRYNLYFY